MLLFLCTVIKHDKEVRLQFFLFDEILNQKKKSYIY